MNIQCQLETNHGSRDLAYKEREALAEYQNLWDMEILDMRQKAEEEWLLFGDRGLKIFHKIMKGKK